MEGEAMPVAFDEVIEKITVAVRQVGADTGLSSDTRESVLAAHLAICKLKVGARRRGADGRSNRVAFLVLSKWALNYLRWDWGPRLVLDPEGALPDGTGGPASARRGDGTRGGP
jgi:hypothetical protein